MTSKKKETDQATPEDLDTDALVRNMKRGTTVSKQPQEAAFQASGVASTMVSAWNTYETATDCRVPFGEMCAQVEAALKRAYFRGKRDGARAAL